MRHIALLMLFLVIALLAVAPCAHAIIYGGPIIEAAVYGNKEFYPGQTAPLLVLVQNSGYVQGLVGYSTPKALLDASSASLQASANYTAESSSYTSSAYEASAVEGTLAGVASAAGAAGTTSTSTSSYSYSRTGAPGDLEINTQSTVPLAATTALGLTCQLSPGSAPLAVISSDTILVGSLPAGCVGGGPSGLSLLSSGLYQPMQFWIQVSPNAPPGHYELPLLVTYKQLADDYEYDSVFGPVLGYNDYVEVSQVICLDIVIMPRFDLLVSNAVGTDMVPGSEGIVTMTVTNLGTMPVDQAVVFLMEPTLGATQDDVNYPLNYQLLSTQAYSAEQPQAVQQTMVVPEQNSQYLGHMSAGESRKVNFTVSISDDAEEGSFPLSAVVSYDDTYDQEKSSNVDTFGIYVEPEMRFTVQAAAPVEIKCGRSCVANLTLANNGTQVARDAIVRMNALDPFTVSYDTMYLGNVAPGQNESTVFGIKVKPDAVPGDYYVTLEVKYYDSQDDPHVTKTICLEIIVLPPPTLLETITENWPLVLGLAALLVLGAIYMGYKWLRRRRRSPPAAAPPPPEEAGGLVTRDEERGA